MSRTLQTAHAHPYLAGARACLLSLFALVAATSAGCGKPTVEADLPAPRTPKEAASQVEAVFEPAPAEIKATAEMASDAMRSADYERAVVSLVTLRDRQTLTLEQGITVHRSLVALESQLLRGVESGDPQAKQAYETLRKLKRN